jgi:hypothetical protein
MITAERPAWRIALHTFTAFMVLSFGIKGLYFLGTDKPQFMLRRYPRMDELSEYVLIAMILALTFSALVWLFYHSVATRLARALAPSTSSDLLHPFAEHLLLIVAAGALAWFLFERGGDMIAKVRTGTILLRNSMPREEDYVTGAYGLSSFLYQIRNGFFIICMSYSLIHRKYIVTAIATAYFVGAAVVSDGSRFTLLASLLMLPLMAYLVHWRRDSHAVTASRIVYLLVLVLPFSAGPLLLLRSRGELSLQDDLTRQVADAALSTFDSLDHLVNYLYVLPIDWSGSRVVEEFWQFLPRAFYSAKPSLYGMLSLQEVLYPHTVGGGGRYLFLGHYPLSCVVMAMDAAGPIGFLLHAICTGALLAWIDSLARRRTVMAVAVITAYLTTSYHLVRVGIEIYAIQSVAGFLLPFGAVGAFLRLARVGTPVRSRAPAPHPGGSLALGDRLVS